MKGFLLLFLMAFFLLPANAVAQGSYQYSPRMPVQHPSVGPHKRGQGMDHPYLKQYGPGGAPSMDHPSVRPGVLHGFGASSDPYVIIPQAIFMSLLRPPADSDADVILRLQSPVDTGGCRQPTPLTYEIKHPDAPLYLDIVVHGYYETPTQKTDQVRGYKPCTYGEEGAVTDIPMRRTDFEGLRQIRFHIKHTIDYFNVHLEDHVLRLRPARTTFFKAVRNSRINDPLGYWFLPDHTVVLYASGAFPGQDVQSAVTRLARSKGFVPLEERLDIFVPRVRDANAFYFVDMARRVAPHLPAGQTQMIGRTTLEDRAQTDVLVYARKPNIYE